MSLEIAAAIMATEYYLHHQKSVGQVKSKVAIFRNLANGEDGRRYFKDECHIVKDHLSKLMPRMHALRQSHLDEIENLKREASARMAKMQDFLGAIEGYLDKYSQLQVKNEKLGKKEASDAANRELDNSSEKIKLSQLLVDDSPLSFAQLLFNIDKCTGQNI